MSTLRVDKITPYQSGSVTIEGSVIQPNAATTGSNTFVGNQNIQGTLTASIQEGYVLVGGSGNVSTLAPTSSFGGGGGGSDITALNAFTASQQNLNTTFATTGSNSFTGSNIFSGSLNATGSLQFRSPSYRDSGAPYSGSVFTLSPSGITLLTKPSASLSVGVIQTYDNEDGNAVVRLYGKTTQLGTISSTLVEIGNNDSFNGYRGNNYYYGDITGSKTIKANSFTGSFTGSVDIAPSKAIIFSDEHIAISSYGLVPNTSGSYVLKIGQGAGNVNQVSFNTFIGHYAGYSNTTGQSNTYVGMNAGYNNVAGIENTYVGHGTATGAVSGSQNAVLGYGTAYYSNGNSNTFIGTRTVSSLGTGSENVVVGAYAATGSSNDQYLLFLSASVILGYGASPMDDNETNQVIIGHKAIGNGSNTVTIGNNNITNTYLKGTISGSTFTGSFVGNGSGLTNLTLPSGVVSGSIQVLGGSGILSSSETNFTDFSQSVDTRIDNIVTGTGFATTSSFNELTQSFNSFTSSQEDLNGTFATTGSNTFVGNQGITGSIVVSGSISQKGVGGNGNIVIGEAPLTNMTTEAVYNVIIGQNAGILNSSGSSNVYVGRSAGILNQIGNSNVMVGTYAGYNAKGSQNVYIGESAGGQNISGNYNIAIGHQAGYNNKVNSNTFIGFQSGFQNTSGSANTFVGERSGESNTIGGNNSFFGGASGRDNSVGSNNTFIGQNAGQQNTSGSYSTFIGSQAGTYTTTGNNNTFVGAQAGILNTLGYSNAFFGDNSGYNNTTAYENTFVGSFSGYENRTGARNTFLGTSAGQETRVGNDNTYVGHRAGNSNISGSNNTYVGLHAGFNITSGSDNTFFGKNSGYYISDGSSAVSGSNRSVFIGTNVKSNGHDETNQIVIGYDAVGNGTNTVTIGNNDITDTYVKGTLRASTAILAQVSSSYNFADDSAAASGGVPLGGLYHTSGSIKIRLV